MNGSDTITIITSDEQKPARAILVQWALKPMIESSPAAVAWAEPAGKEHHATVTLQHLEGRPFRILGARASSPMICAEASSRTVAVQQKVKITLSAEAKAGTFANERVTLITDDPDQPELSIRVSAILR